MAKRFIQIQIINNIRRKNRQSANERYVHIPFFKGVSIKNKTINNYYRKQYNRCQFHQKRKTKNYSKDIEKFFILSREHENIHPQKYKGDYHGLLKRNSRDPYVIIVYGQKYGGEYTGAK